MANKNDVKFTNVLTGQSILLSFVATVSYSNGTRNDATLTVTCGSATVTPASQTVSPGSGTANFTVTHTAAGTGHTLSAVLMQNGSRLTGTDVTVNVTAPGPGSG